MKKFVSLAATALLVAGLSAGAASAKQKRHHVKPSQGNMQGGVTTGAAPMRGNNAELMGNNANSGSGDNSLGHIKGGNIGGGK